MKKQSFYTKMASVAYHSSIIWVLTLPWLILHGLALAILSPLWTLGIVNWYDILLSIATHQLLSITLLLLNLLSLCSFVLSITAIALGATMRLVGDIRIKISSFIYRKASEHSTKAIDKRQTKKK